jgi:hypothetical protein
VSRKPSRDQAAELPAVELVLHPDSPRFSIQSLQARASLLDLGLLSLGFTLTGALEELEIPPIADPERRDRLWEHTCFEAFIQLPGTEGYLELNLAPSTHWAAMRFSGYRQDGQPQEDLDPRLVVIRKGDRLDLHAMVRLDRAFPLKPTDHLKLALSAVLESKRGELSYWAIRHPKGQPDFHAPEAFALDVAPLPDED